MSRAEIPFAGRVGVVCDECHQPDEAVSIARCGWCDEDICEECQAKHARECHEEECMCQSCVERRVCAAEARADAARDR